MPSPSPAALVQGYRHLEFASWEDARLFGMHLTERGWMFRGHTDAGWSLKPTLERAMVGRESPASDMVPLIQADIGAFERRIIGDFQSRAHHYVPAPPKWHDRLEWVALLQHHGGPTRLLDFTESFYIAAHFATGEYERMYTRAPKAAIWAIDCGALFDQFFKWFMALDLEALAVQLKRHPLSSKIKNLSRLKRHGVPRIRSSLYECIRPICTLALMGHINKGLVAAIRPNRLNERLALQQGLLVLSLGGAFEDALGKTFGLSPDVFSSPAASVCVAPGHAQSTLDAFQRDDLTTDSSVCVMKLTLPGSMQREAVRDLRHMNISDASLFPGLDGFARSLYERVATLDLYLPQSEQGR